MAGGGDFPPRRYYIFIISQRNAGRMDGLRRGAQPAVAFLGLLPPNGGS